MNKIPKISIITATYNQDKFIERTIQSVVSQNYPHLEYIIFDNLSDDRSEEIISKYKKKVIYIREKDKGQSDGINKGLKRVTGDIIGYLNSDDILLPGCLYKVSAFFKLNPDIMWVTGKCKIINEEDNIIRSFISAYKNFWLRYLRIYKSLLILNYISQPATFWRRDALNRIGIFDKSLHLAMDYDYWLRLAKIYKLGYINEYLSAFRVHGKSKSERDKIGLIDEGYTVAQRYSPGFYLKLHKIHDLAVKIIYRII